METEHGFNHSLSLFRLDSIDCASENSYGTIKPMNDALLVYGASGYTGKLVTSEACALGLKPQLGGRNIEKVRAVAAGFGLESRAATLEDPAQLAKALEGIRVVLNTAGPFSATAQPL